jgi:hypothetical protein
VELKVETNVNVLPEKKPKSTILFFVKTTMAAVLFVLQYPKAFFDATSTFSIFILLMSHGSSENEYCQHQQKVVLKWNS